VDGFTADLVTNVSSYSLNVNEASGNGLSYISLTELLPLDVSCAVQYYLTGFAGVWMSATEPVAYAVVQTVYLLNTDNVYTTIALKLTPITNASTQLPCARQLPSYCVNADLCFYLDLANGQLLVDNLNSLQEYLNDHTGTIMTSDLRFGEGEKNSTSLGNALPDLEEKPKPKSVSGCCDACTKERKTIPPPGEPREPLRHLSFLELGRIWNPWSGAGAGGGGP